MPQDDGNAGADGLSISGRLKPTCAEAVTFRFAIGGRLRLEGARNASARIG